MPVIILESERQEVFHGSETGEVNITLLRKWLVAKERKAEMSAMEAWNVADLLLHHEWDETKGERIADLLAHKNKWEPLICFNNGDGSVFVIDGWHRLQILFDEREPGQRLIGFLTYMVTRAECEMFKPDGIAIKVSA